MKLELKILLVEDDEIIINLIKKIFKEEDYIFEIATEKEEALNILQNNVFRLIIVDYDLCEGTIVSFLKERKVVVPMVVISSQDIDKQTYLQEGALAIVSKPFYGQELLYTVKNLLKLTDVYKGLEESGSIIRALTSALDYRDSYTEGHSIRVLEFALMLYAGMGLNDKQEKDNLRLGCVLHDIGKIGIPDDILKSHNKLSWEEREIIKEHPSVGYEICKEIKHLQGSLNIIKWHHEKLDGSGYPEGLKEREIPMLVQIVSIADIFDALTSKRTYREEMSVKESLKILNKEANEGKLNKYLVSFFIKIANDKLRKRGAL